MKLSAEPSKFRRVKVVFFTRGGKGNRAWRQPHERYAWVPLDQAGDDQIVITFPDLGDQQCTILSRDTLVIPGDLIARCEEVE